MKRFRAETGGQFRTMTVSFNRNSMFAQMAGTFNQKDLVADWWTYRSSRRVLIASYSALAAGSQGTDLEC